MIESAVFSVDGDRVSVDKKTLDSFFDSVEIESDYLRALVEKVLSIINRPDLHFRKISECPIFGNEGLVTREGEICLDSRKLIFLGDEMAMALIAHEMAHYHLGHYVNWKYSPEKQREADDLARSWGFNIDNYREEFPIDGEET